MSEELVESFTFYLRRAVSYASNGQTVEGKHLIIYCPSSSQMQDLAILDEEYQRAMFGLADQFKNMMADAQEKAGLAGQKQDPSDPKSADSTYSVLAASRSSNLDRVFHAFRRILLKSKPSHVCVVGDDHVGMTSHILDQIDARDFRQMLGMYINYFLV